MSDSSSTGSSWKDFFPYKPRKLQETIVKTLTREIRDEKHVVFEAANGTGKTIAALASLLPIAQEKNLKILYLARTHSQIDRVLDELTKISEIRKVTGLALRGRGAFCLNELVLKFAKTNHSVHVMCSQLKTAKRCDYFNNMKIKNVIEPAIAELLRAPATAEYIFEVTQDAKICPAETARKLLPSVQVIACSYLYLFDPMIRDTFLEQIDCDIKDLIVVIDEAHNLPEMVNAINSDEISSFSLSRAIREAKNNNKPDFLYFLEILADFFGEKNKTLGIQKEEWIDPALFLEDIELKCDIELDDEFFNSMRQLGDAIRYKLAKAGKEPRSSVGRIGEFFYRLYESIGLKDYTHSIERKKFSGTRDTFVTLKLDSLDSSKVIYPILRDVYASVSMSGTLGDPDAYALLTGIRKLHYVSNIMPSPYGHGNIQCVVPEELTTLYAKRSPTMWKNMVKLISSVANATPKNVGIFTPSYAILRELMNNGLEANVLKPIYEAKLGMTSLENDKLVSRFKRHGEKDGAVLCSVLGGRSSEGADFPGDLMQTVIVVGIPFAPPDNKTNARIAYLDSKFPGKGRMLAYFIPALNRASQAAGRPVRSITDRAFIMLLDFRYANDTNSQLLPEWIRSQIKLVKNDPEKVTLMTEQFFKNSH